MGAALTINYASKQIIAFESLAPGWQGAGQLSPGSTRVWIECLLSGISPAG